MSNPDPRAEIAKIEETIRNLQKLKEQGVLPAEQADTSIAALKHQLASYSAQLEGDGGLAQGAGAKAVGRDGILIEGNVYMGPEPEESTGSTCHLSARTGQPNQFPASARCGCRSI